MSSGAGAKPGAPPKIGRTIFQATTGVLFGIALIVATGRTVIRARTYKSNGFTIDDGFFLLAVITFLAGTVMTYVDVPHFYLEENVEAGLASPPANFIPLLILGEKLEDAVTSLLGVTIVSVKFSFLFFFRALLRQQKKLMVWWWCIFAMLIPTAFLMIFAIFIVCAYWNQEIFVKCVTPAAYLRQNGVLQAITILDIFTDAFLISIPVLLLWNVRISIRRKVALCGILCLSVCTLIISIIKVAGGKTSAGGVDSSWSYSAFRALFVAHQAMKYRTPAESDSTSWNRRSKKAKNSRSKELPEIPSPVLSGVRTHIRGSQYGGGSFDRGGDDMELPLQGPGIIVTQEVHSEKTQPPLSSSNSSANASQADGPLASSSILSHLIIECDANLYGQGLNYDSCHDAYDQIPHFVSEMTWGPRTQGRWSVNLPWRAYSSTSSAEAQGHPADGSCAINVSSRSGVAVSDKESWYRIAQAAFEVLEQCVRPETWGGSLKNLGTKTLCAKSLASKPNRQLTDRGPSSANRAGQKSNLIVSVLSYTPHVHCSAPRAAAPPPTTKACAELQNRMFASADALVFGPIEAPGVEVGLPQSWLLPTSAADLGSCAMVVNTRGPLDRASWFEVWAGAGAVAAMCQSVSLYYEGLDGIKMQAPSL
ncbi:MAG: hypothetical protein ASARMPRED_005103 [Alectoria sarmentosa]|nr:MAG: hypothetical protein ASARMPRED_005103 [Alectoria sarmentosa]